MAQAKKCFGELPENVVVLSEVVEFDAEGYATVSDEVAAVLEQIPGYTILKGAEEAAPEDPAVDPEAAPEDPAVDPEAAPDNLAGATTSMIRRPIRRAVPVN